MKRTPNTAAPVVETSPPLADEASRVVARPDGYYWVADHGRQEFGPFASMVLALAALRDGIGTAPEPGETVIEAEAEIGMAEWVDPETGQPAEEAVTRLEDH